MGDFVEEVGYLLIEVLFDFPGSAVVVGTTEENVREIITVFL